MDNPSRTHSAIRRLWSHHKCVTFIEGATLQELPRPSSASMPRNRGNQRRYQDMDAPTEIADRFQKGLDVLLNQTQGNSEAYDGEATFTTFTRSRTHHHHRVCRSTSGNKRSLAIHSGAIVNHITCDRREVGLQYAARQP